MPSTQAALKKYIHAHEKAMCDNMLKRTFSQFFWKNISFSKLSHQPEVWMGHVQYWITFEGGVSGKLLPWKGFSKSCVFSGPDLWVDEMPKLTEKVSFSKYLCTCGRGHSTHHCTYSSFWTICIDKKKTIKQKPPLLGAQPFKSAMNHSNLYSEHLL